MVRGNMMRWASVVMGAALAMSGCNCSCNPPPPGGDCTDTTITWESPDDGATVDSPFSASFTIKGPDGSAFPIDAATLKVGSATIDGTVSGNRATFSGLTAAAGSVTLTPSIASGSCSKSYAARTVTVRDACSTPAVTAIDWPQDVAPLGVLNRAELPDGTFLQVKVTAMCVASGVQVRIKRGTTEVSPVVAFVNGVATVTTTLPDSDNARYDLFAELVSNGAAVNTSSGNPAANASIQVARALPSCAVTTTGTFGPMDDADSSTTGFQMRVTGTMDPTSSGSMQITGLTPKAVTPSMTGDVSADFTLADSGAYQVTLTCTDANQNTNTATGTFTVDFTPPTVTITSPANVDGGATMVVTQSPLAVTITTDAEDGSIAEVLRDGVPQSSVSVMNGGATLPVPFGMDGTYTVGVRVTDSAGNKTTVSITVSVTLDGCGMAFTRPGACPALLTPAQLNNGTYVFQTSSKSSCANQPAALFRSDVLSDGGITAETAAGTASLTAGGIANFPALQLSNGDFVFRSEVMNIGTDAGFSGSLCRVTVDLDGPAITSPVLPSGSTAVVINALQDTQASTPGVQRTLSFSARVPFGGRTDVCTTQAVDPVTSQNRPTSTECGTGWFLLQQGVTSPASGFTFPEGQYQIKVVVVGGGLGAAPASAALPVFVDGVRPCVSGISRSLPQDANGDGRLNIAELAGASPRLVFALGCGDTAPANLAATNPVVVKDVVGGAGRASTASFANGLYTVTLTGPFTSEIDLNVFVELTDLAGNRSVLLPSNDPGTFTFRVDPVAPSCAITSPTASLLGIAQVPGASLDVLISTSADVGSNGVSVTFTGQAPRALTPSLNQAQTSYSLTGDATYTIGATCTDQSGNSATAGGRTTRVDLVAPTCNITAPANGSSSATNDVASTVAVTGLADGDIVTLASSVSGITNNTLTVAGSTATRVVRFPNGAQTVTASASDAAGNACVAPSGGALQVQLTVNSTSCNIDFAANGSVITNSNGSWINRASAGNAAGVSPVTVSVGAVTSDCGAGKNVYLYAGAPSSSPGGAPAVTNSGGVATFSNVSVSDGQQWTLTIDNGAGILTHRSFTVSFAQPTIAAIALQRSAVVTANVTVAPNAPLAFGAAAGNRRVETATASDLIFGDLDGAAANAQFQLVLTGIDGARVGTQNAQLDVLEGTTPLMATVAVTAAPFTPVLPRMSLGHREDETTTTLVIRVTSPAGNVFTSTHVAEVDVIPPAPPAVTQSLASARTATVNLSWAPVYDDGSAVSSGGLSGGSQQAGYDVRWTTSSIPANNGMASDVDYFGSVSNPNGITAWSGSTSTLSLQLPPLNDYRISVRARDEVGNYSAFSQPAVLSNQWSQVTFTGTAGTNFGQLVTAAQLNGDSLDDLIVTAPNRATNVGSVYIYWGGAGLASVTGCPAAQCQELTPPLGAAGNFGSDVSAAGNVGDLASEQKPDLLISQVGFASNVGRAFLYLGSSGASVDPTPIEFRGDTTTNRFGNMTRIIRDIDGDGLDEVAIGSIGYGSNTGRVYIYKGRSRANWEAARTATDGTTMAVYIPVSGATWILEGPSPLLDATNGNAFGTSRLGVTSLGDLTGDGRSEFVIPMSRVTINRSTIYSGGSVSASVTAVAWSSALQVVSQPVGASSGTNGFGAAAVGGLDVLNANAPDLVLTYPSANTVYVYADLGASGVSGGPSLTITGANSLGTDLSVADVNGDGARDILAGEGLATNNRAWILYRRANTFETSLTGSPFWASMIAGPAGSSLGRSLTVGDLDGVAGVEVVLGDQVLNRVVVWR